MSLITLCPLSTRWEQHSADFSCSGTGDCMTQAVDLGVAYLFNMTSPFVASICSIGSGLKTALVQDNRLFLSVIKPQISSLATGNRQVPNRKEDAFQQVCASPASYGLPPCSVKLHCTSFPISHSRALNPIFSTVHFGALLSQASSFPSVSTPLPSLPL